MKIMLRWAVSVLTSLPGRLFVSAGLLAFVAASVDWEAVGETMSGANWTWLSRSDSRWPHWRLVRFAGNFCCSPPACR